jgi:LysR family transcriptional regulator (chromosome initiation inhibitor)
MRYRCVAALALIAEWSGALTHRLLRRPAVIFNCKDALPDAYLSQHSDLRDALYTRHFVPAVDAFELAPGGLGAIATHF